MSVCLICLRKYELFSARFLKKRGETTSRSRWSACGRCSYIFTHAERIMYLCAQAGKLFVARIHTFHYTYIIIHTCIKLQSCTSGK